MQLHSAPRHQTVEACEGIIVIIMTFNTFYWFDSFFWQAWYGNIIGGIILVVLIIAIFATAEPRPKPVDWDAPFGALRKAFGG